VLLFDLEEQLPAIEVDPTQLQQVLVNLLVNAIDAVESVESGEICVSSRHIGWKHVVLSDYVINHIEGRGPFVQLEVRDNGCGICGVHLERIFEPFYTTKSHGSGLGLAAVAGVMRAASGAVHLSSTVAGGTCFQLLFSAAVAAPASEAVVEEEGASGMLHAGGVILLVDDEATVRSVARRMLEKSGLQVIEAANGVDALALLEQHGETVSLVLLDFTMPGMNGYELFLLIRRRLPELPVVVSSGYGEVEEIVRMQQQGVAFVQKPFRYELLMAVIVKYLPR